MSLNCLSRVTCNFPISSFSFLNPQTNLNLTSQSTIKSVIAVTFEDVAAIAQNKVLIAAGVSGAIGQLLKPFTSVLLYGKSFDLKGVIQAGGFPSTHSSAVVATATSLALERGFSDSIFGLSVVYAALVMYDAQGVRREVSIHAKTINRALLKRQEKSPADQNVQDTEELSTNSYGPLKEAVGHTEIEVIAGAFFGFLVSLTVHALM